MLNYHLFPKEGDLLTQIMFVLQYAVRAPSTHNSQPWHFKIEGDKVSLFADWSRKLPVGDKDGRDLYISLGACLEHLTITLRYFRMGGSYRVGDLVNPKAAVAEVSVHLSEGEDVQIKPVIEAIEKRFNARGPFLLRSIPAEVFLKLPTFTEGGTTLYVSQEKSDISKLAELTAQGMLEVHAQKSFRTELSGWMINNYSSRKEGIPGYTMLAPGPLSIVLPWVIRMFNMGTVLGKLNIKSISSAQGVGIISAKNDTPLDWIQTGMLFERVSLYLNTYGIFTSIYVASIEVTRLRVLLREHFKQNEFPQFTFAFGYPAKILKQSPRHEPIYRIIQHAV